MGEVLSEQGGRVGADEETVAPRAVAVPVALTSMV
jgi:hypothetical protein